MRGDKQVQISLVTNCPIILGARMNTLSIVKVKILKLIKRSYWSPYFIEPRAMIRENRQLVTNDRLKLKTAGK